MKLRELIEVQCTKTGREPHKGSLLCFDPGHTTGWAHFSGDHLTHAEQIDTSDMELATKNIGDLISTFLPDTIVFEEYRVYKWRAKHHAGSDLLTARVIGCIETIAMMNGIPLIRQPAHVAKGFCTDTKLKAWNMYQTGLKHARDAIRHGCYFLIFGNVNAITKGQPPKPKVG